MGRPHTARRHTRRALLAGLGGSVALAGGGVVSGHPTPDGTAGPGPDTGTPSTPQATPAGFGPLAHLHVPGTKEVVVDAAGEIAYLATTSGFATVNVNDPAAPRLLADRRRPLADLPGGPLVEIHDIDYADERLLVVGPANPVEDAIQAAAVYDVSDPADPVRQAVFETDYPIHNATLDGAYGYLTGNDFERNAMVIIDPVAGESVGHWSVADVDSAWLEVDPILWIVHDVTVHDDLAFVANWDAGTWIIDVADRTAPTTLARVRGREPTALTGLTGGAVHREQLERPGNDHYAAPNGDGSILGLGIESWDVQDTEVDGGPGGLQLWDISTPTDPTHLTTIEPPATADPGFAGMWTSAHNFSFHQDRLYTSWYRGGVRVYDVTDPARPQLRAAWRNDDQASFWAARVAVPGSFFVASARETFGVPGSQEDSITGGVYTFPDPHRGDTPTETDLPGFGPVAGLAGAGLGVLRAWQRARR